MSRAAKTQDCGKEQFDAERMTRLMKEGRATGNAVHAVAFALAIAACGGVSAFAADEAAAHAVRVRPFAEGERVTFLGDSITHGGLYHANLQLFWDLRFPGSGTRLMNCGVSGGTAGGGVARWGRDVLPQNADRVFVMFGMNDVGHGEYETTRWTYDVLPRRKGLEAVSFQPEPKFDKDVAARRNARLDSFRKNMAQIADDVQSAGKRLVLMTPTPYDEYGDLYTPERRIGVNSQGLALFAEACRELVAERKAELLDLHAPLTEFVRIQRDFMFCRMTDRVHPTPVGHVIMTALILETMGVSPVVAQVEMDADGRVAKAVRAEVSEVAASPRGLSFRYAPSALPFPASDDYRKADAVYPVSEKMNMETLRVSGLPSGDYDLAADGAPLGTFSAGQLAEGVNLALLATPGAKLAMDAWKISRELASLQSRRRSIVLIEEVAAGQGAKLGDYDDICGRMDAFVQRLKKNGSSSAGYYAGKLDDYRRDKARSDELREQEDACRRRLAEAAARKSSCVLSLSRSAGDRVANVADGVICWGYILDRTPTACPFMIGRTDFSLERATSEFGAKRAMYMNSMFNREYVRSSFPYWPSECFENCIENRMSDAQLDKLRDVPEVWCAAMHGGKLESAIKIAEASLRHPNIVGVNFDDFCIPSAAEETLERFRAMKSAVRAVNPRLKFAVVSYAKDANGTNLDLSPYREEIDLVSRWKWVTDTNYWHHLRADIAELRRQVGPRAKIVQGLYFHDFSRSIEKGADPLPLDYLKLSVNTALDAVADGTLDGVILPQVAWYSAPSHRAQYEWLRARILSLEKSRASQDPASELRR